MATLLFTDEIPEVLREVEKFAQGFTAGDEERLRRVTGAVFTRTWERKGEHASFCTMREHSGVEMERGAQF